MLTLLSLLAVVVVLVLHEDPLARAHGRFIGGIARRILLLALLGSAVTLGARIDVLAGVRSALNVWRTEPARAYPSRDLLFRDTLEAQQPERPFPMNGTVEDVRAWQTQISELLRTRADFSSVPSSVSFHELESEDIGDVRRTLLEFSSWDGTRIPAYVHRPNRPGKLPAVLVIPGHGRGIRATSGIGPAEYQHAVALELARRGYVTLTPELRGFGFLGNGDVASHAFVAHAALEAGSFYKAIVARDLQLALSLLQTWDGVEASRVGVLGTSLGGELAVFLGVLDPRPRVIISHSYGGVLGPVSLPEPAEGRQSPHGCHTIPGINSVLHQEDWFRLLAPRAVQVVRGSQNVSNPSTAERFVAAASMAYERTGARDRFEFSIEPGEHEFFTDAAVRFLAKWL